MGKFFDKVSNLRILIMKITVSQKGEFIKAFA